MDGHWDLLRERNSCATQIPWSCCVLVFHRINSGYKNALETGSKRAIADAFKCIVTLDADSQHNPAIIKDFVVKIDDQFEAVVF